jgi:hypothetical protein
VTGFVPCVDLWLTLFIPEASSLFAAPSSTRVPFTALSILNPVIAIFEDVEESGLISGSAGQDDRRLEKEGTIDNGPAFSVESSPS